jgi:hypothetical protein
MSDALVRILHSLSSVRQPTRHDATLALQGHSGQPRGPAVMAASQLRG